VAKEERGREDALGSRDARDERAAVFESDVQFMWLVVAEESESAKRERRWGKGREEFLDF
jgi:hypothetical protein